MRAVYTVCTYNHIGRAFSLGDSIRKRCPDARFIICLLDNPDASIELDFEILRAEELELPFLGEMYSKYSPLELNSAMKPYFASHILSANAAIQDLIYFDSDILIYNDLSPVFECLDGCSVIMTPHSMSTVPEGPDFDDRIFLRSGIYNAGFFGFKNDENALSFLTWWKGKLRNQCFFDSKRGMFAEQLWLNLAPLYFDCVKILKHPGCNVSYWNLHERHISEVDGRYLVNGKYPLIFFHFSGASTDSLKNNLVSQHQQRYSFTSNPELVPLFKEYIESLNKYSFNKYSGYYTISSRIKTNSVLLKAVAAIYQKFVKRLYIGK